MGEIRVRAGAAADIAAVLRVERAVVEAPHWSLPSYEQIFPGGGGGWERRMFVAEAADAVVGFSVGRMGGDGVGEIESVAVAVSARRCGVGRALCAAVVAWCGERGAEAVELEVRAGGEAALALYAGLGFVVEGRRRGYYREPEEDAVLMRLRLR